MKYLVLIDADGTLLNSQGFISKRNVEAIKNFKSHGHIIVICSGRSRPRSLKIKKLVDVSDILISSNGAEIYDTSAKHLIYNAPIPYNCVIDLYNYAINNQITIKLAIENAEYSNHPTDNQKIVPKNPYFFFSKTQIKQIMFSHPNKKVLNKLKKYIYTVHQIKVMHETLSYHEVPWFSVSNVFANKGYSLNRLKKYIDVPLKTVTIGNDYNDISMFQQSDESYVMDNGNDIVKIHADYITKSNDEDGVAIVLEKILQKNIG